MSSIRRLTTAALLFTMSFVANELYRTDYVQEVPQRWIGLIVTAVCTIGAIAALMSFFSPRSATQNKQLRRADYLETHLDSREIKTVDIDRMAEELGLNPFTLNRALLNVSGAEPDAQAKLEATHTKEELLRYLIDYQPGSRQGSCLPPGPCPKALSEGRIACAHKANHSSSSVRRAIFFCDGIVRGHRGAGRR